MSLLTAEHDKQLFGSDRSPRRGNLVHASVRDFVLRMALKEFLTHSKESRGVLVQASRASHKREHTGEH